LDLRASLKSFDQLRPRGRPPQFAPRRWAVGFRQLLRTHIERCFPRHQAVLRALLLGERAGLDNRMTAALARSGLIHLLAISGLHVGLAVGAAYALARISGMPRPAAALIAGIALLGIVGIVAARPPVLRAACMASTSLAAIIRGRRSSALDGWAFAVFCLTLHNPLSVHDFGFQLSATATLGILLAAPAIASSVDASRWKLPSYFKALVLTSFVAQVSVAPLLATHTHRIPLAGLVLNVVAIPLLTITLTMATVALIISVSGLIWLPASALAACTEAGIDILLATASFAEGTSVAGLVVPAGRSAYVMGLAMMVLLALYRSGWSRRFALVVACFCLCCAAWPVAPPDNATFVALDVGQGDSLLFWPPATDPVLIDGGGSPRTDFDTGTAIVAPTLRGLGAQRLHAVVISHLHADHAGGVPGLLREIPAREIWVSFLPPEIPLAGKIRAAGRTSRVRYLRTGDRGELGGCSWRALHPPRSVSEKTGPEELNDTSVVLEQRCGPRRLLLPGDTEQPAERQWGPLAATFRGGVLKIAHHGSNTSSSAALLDRLAPRVAVISAGWRNRFGFPHKPVLARLRRSSTAVYRTDRDGAITVELGRRVTVRGERWTSGRPG
jgi:competence protein ComEC